MRPRALLAAVLVLSACTAGGDAPDEGFWPFTSDRLSAPSPDGTAIKIGAIFSTTGGVKWLDTPGLNGFRLAAEEINQTGGILGRPVQVVHIDGETHPLTIQASVEQMIARGVVALGGLLEPTFALAPLRGAVRLPSGGLVSFDRSSTVPYAAEVAARAGVPVVAAGAIAPPPGVVSLSAGFDRLVDAALDHAWSGLGARTAWILADDGSTFTTSMAAAFRQRWHATGGRILGEAPFRAGSARHIDEQLATIRGLDAAPDVVLLAAMPNELGILMDEIRAAGIRAPVVSAAAYDSPYIVAFAEERADGLWFSTDVSLLDPDPRVRSFAARYERAYGRSPEHTAAASGYDTMRLIAATIERVGTTDAAAISSALEGTEGFPVLGGTFGVAGGIGHRPVAIMSARDGRLRFEQRR